ncbi:MAG: hypothetical protein NC200_05360 [Candidatus Gastranaerophilales bacterium]|nr:hypothetical protein [Candidatus Gastranaerophilales bacterium]
MAELRNVMYEPMLIDKTGIYKNSSVSNNIKVTYTGDDDKIADELAGKKATDKKETSKAKDGKDDGSVGFWGALGNMAKGVGNFFKGMVCDKEGNFSIGQCLKTVAIGAVIGAASILIPGAGTAIAIGALALAGKNVISAGIDVAKAKTDAEAEEAWQNMGSGLTEGALAYVGARSTGAFGTIKNAGKLAKSTGSDLYSAYRAGGWKGLKTEANSVRIRAWDGITRTYKSTEQGTIDNYRNLTNAKSKHDTRIKAYDEKIKAAKGADKKALQAEKAAYENGYNRVATETNYETAYNTLETMRADLAKAKAAATKKGASAKAKANYKKQLAEYEAAESTLKARVNNGDFKVKTRKGTKSRKVSNAEKATENAYNEMVAKRDALRQSPSKKAQAEYDKAFNEYSKAVANEKAIKGHTSKRYILSQTVGEGMKKPSTLWLTLAYGGRDTVQKQYQYVA